MSATPATSDTAPPTLGQHTDEVLREVLGKDEAQIAALRDDGIV
jgi:formyl-CoA transferase